MVVRGEVAGRSRREASRGCRGANCETSQPLSANAADVSRKGLEDVKSKLMGEAERDEDVLEI
jgi:hypothetical protein